MERQFHASYRHNDGDILLRSSDDVHFRIHSIVLKLASGFFREMLELPRSADESPTDAIPLVEDSRVIACLLDLIYPGGSKETDGGASPRLPKINDLDFAWKISNAADKYDMPRALAAVRAIVMVSEPIRGEPLGLYALARRWKWDEEARTASNGTLSVPLLRRENLPTLRTMDSESLCKLVELHMKRKEEVLKFFDLEHRDSKTFIVYQWECSCSTELDGTRTDLFARYWDTMRDVVISSLDACPSGNELLDQGFWSKKDLRLWSFACQHCNKIIINKSYFIKRINDVFKSAKLPTTIS